MSIVEKVGRIIGTAQFVAEKAGEGAVVLGSRLSPFACGSTVTRLDVHDHKRFSFLEDSENGLYVENLGGPDVPYDEKHHGAIDKTDWAKEGKPLPSGFTSTTGKQAIHRHGGKSSSGSQEYTYK